jgi:hypothetical protein
VTTRADLVITSSSEADAPDVEAVYAGLRAFNARHAGPSGLEKVHLFVRDPGGTVQGGLLGKRLWSWLYVDTLWVAEPLRGSGWGTRLLERA